MLDLTAYTSDPETPDYMLLYTLVSQSNTNCGVRFDSSLVSVSPARDWTGSCTVTYQVSDSLKHATGSFNVQVLAVVSRRHLPIVSK